MRGEVLCLDKHALDVRIFFLDPDFESTDGLLNLGGGQVIRKVETCIHQNIVWPQMHGQEFVQADNTTVTPDDLRNAVGDFGARAFADQKPLAFDGKGQRAVLECKGEVLHGQDLGR